MKRQQIIFIHGGETFRSYEEYLNTLRKWTFDPVKDVSKRWNRNLDEFLGEGFEVIRPTMPCKYNAKYREWKIWFEKVLEFAQDGVIFIGHSLGGTFLVKYFTQDKTDFDKRVKAIFLIAAAVSDEANGYHLSSFCLDEDKIFLLQDLTDKIFIAHSQDDPVVPFVDAEILSKHLPQAEKMIFTDRGHFLDETFPELVKKIEEISGK